MSSAPERIILWVLGFIILMTVVNRLTVQRTNRLARQLSFISYILVGLSGIVMAPSAIEIGRTMQDPLLCMLPAMPWLLCLYLVRRWLRLTPQPEATTT